MYSIHMLYMTGHCHVLCTMDDTGIDIGTLHTFSFDWKMTVITSAKYAKDDYFNSPSL